MIRRPPRSTRTDTLFPYTTLFRSQPRGGQLATTKQAYALEVQSKDTRLHVVPAFPNLNKPIVGGDGIRELTRDEVRIKKPIESSYRLSSDESHVGKECVSTCSSRWSSIHQKKKSNKDEVFEEK